MSHARQLVDLYRQFYRASRYNSNSILRPMAIAAKTILNADPRLFEREGLTEAVRGELAAFMERVRNNRADGRLSPRQLYESPEQAARRREAAMQRFAEYFVGTIFYDTFRGDVAALRGRAARLYPRNEERQESAVAEFWSNLYAPPDRPGSLPILARYDGLRPLVPWLIRVFQNYHISELRKDAHLQPFPDDDVIPDLPVPAHDRWHDVFCLAAREWLQTLQDRDLLILGLRLRYQMNQREVAALLGMHEGTLSRHTDKLSEQWKTSINEKMLREGWTGDDLSEYIRTEMRNLLLDDPRLGVDHLAHLLAAQGKSLPVSG